jgi:peptidoglycan/LPS O-acetylase OafA/YrhL
MNDAPAVTPRAPRYYSLDHWRGFAVLLVLIFHSSLYVLEDYQKASGSVNILFRVISTFWVGVSIFFVISGYCIAGACDSSRWKKHAIGSYFLRRFRRIFPPFWIFVLCAAPIVLIAEQWLVPGLFTDSPHPIYSPTSLSLRQWLGNLSLTESWTGSLFSSQRFWAGHIWTLCYEEQFYAVMGLLLLLHRQHFFKIIAVCTPVFVLINLLVSKAGYTFGFFFDGQWLLFAAGVLVYWQVNYGEKRHLCFTYACLGLALGYAGLCWGIGSLPSPFGAFGPFGHVVGFGFALALCFLQPRDLSIARAQVVRPLAFCGSMCYSLYLTHWPVVKAVSHQLYLSGIRGQALTLIVVMPVCLVVSLGIGWAFHIMVERRFLNSPPAFAAGRGNRQSGPPRPLGV